LKNNTYTVNTEYKINGVTDADLKEPDRTEYKEHRNINGFVQSQD